MKITDSNKFKVCNVPQNANASLDIQKVEEDITYITVKYSSDEVHTPDMFKVCFSVPNIDAYSTWSPLIGAERGLNAEWAKQTTDSRIASGMPVHSLVSLGGENRLCIAVSDTATPISIKTGVVEYTAEFACEICFFTSKQAPIKEYTAVIRLDTRSIPFYDCIYNVTNWWENECGCTPAFVPEYARLPINSLWYSYHTDLKPHEIVEECVLSKALGMESVIIDDGWESDISDQIPGYFGKCGDWEPVASKVGDMAEWVEKLHGTGMKVLLWFSVPFVGVFSKAFEHFKGKLLGYDENNLGEFYCLDPRYKEVRDYLTNVYVKAVSNYKLDGLKLDFIDHFRLFEMDTEIKPEMDFVSLEDGIDALMTQVTDALRDEKPDIMIEFRQTYIGPYIRRYGNMLRVTDCPNDAIKNRRAIADMRFTSGNTPVHSDMLMWHYDDKVESAALQFASVLYSVPQISVKIKNLSDEHKKMLAFYLGFWKQHREILLDGKLSAQNPEMSYSLVRSDLDSKSVITVYSNVMVDGIGENSAIVNASQINAIFIKNCKNKSYDVVNCMGELLSSGTIKDDLFEIKVPISGICFIK